MSQEIRPEFSFVVHPSAIAEGGRGESYELEASAAECAALAARFELQALEFFRASVWLARVRGSEGIRLRGRITARAVQSCVVTLDPVVADVDEEFELLLLPEEEGREETVDPEDDVETFTGDEIDIGEIAAEEMALALDPYPRSAEAEAGMLGPVGPAGESEGTGDPESAGHRPFEALARLRRSK